MQLCAVVEDRQIYYNKDAEETGKLKKSTEGSRIWARHLVYVVSVPGLVVGSLLYRLWSPLGHPLQLSCMPVLAGSFETWMYMKIKGQKRFLPPSNSPWPHLIHTAQVGRTETAVNLTFGT